MNIRRNGYTLVELMVSISLLIIVMVGGTAIFYRSFRSSGVSDIQASINSNLRSVGEKVERVLRYGEIDSVGVSDRSICLSAGTVGVSGSTLSVKDLGGGVANYSFELVDGVGLVSSNSSVISNPEIDVTVLNFTWICRSGVNDKIKLLIEANAKGKSGEVVSGIIDKDINLLNSGI